MMINEDMENNNRAQVQVYAIPLSNEDKTFLEVIKTILSEESLPEEYFDGEHQALPRLRDINNVAHRDIVEKILKLNEYLVWLGPTFANFHGYFGERYTLFRNLNQKLNLAMNHIYSADGQRIFNEMDQAGRDKISLLLCDHLGKMLEDTALFGHKEASNMGRILNLLKESIQTTIAININTNSLSVNLDTQSVERMNQQMNTSALRINTFLREQEETHRREIAELKRQQQQAMKKFKEEIQERLDLVGIPRTPPETSYLGTIPRF